MLIYNQYKDYKNIDKETGRVYDIPPGLYPSVTTILSATANNPGIAAWKIRVGEEEANRIKNEAASRGTIVHQYLEDYCTDFPKGGAEDAKHFIENSKLHLELPFIQQMVKVIINQLVLNNYVSVAQEFVVWDTELKLAGRCDNLGYWNNSLTLVDFKTSKKIKPITFIKDYFIQATAYCKAHNQMFHDQIKKFVIIIANEEGGYQVIHGNPAHYVGELKYRVRTFYEKHAK